MSEMYTERLLDHYLHPRNRGRLPQRPDECGLVFTAEEYNPLCGDRVRIELRVQDGQVAEAYFDGRGCAVCLGAASILTEVIEGKNLEELRGLGRSEFLVELQSSIRPARLKCALLPWIAFRRAAYGEDQTGEE